MTGVRHESVAVAGCGHVGATSAYALMLSGVAREIVLVDADPRRAEGEAMDLRQAVALSRPVDVRAGDWRDAARASLAVIAAGVGGRPGESRLDLLGRNAVVVREVMKRLLGEGFGGVVLMTTNPVDVLSQFAQEDSGLPVSTRLTGQYGNPRRLPEPALRRRPPRSRARGGNPSRRERA